MWNETMCAESPEIPHPVYETSRHDIVLVRSTNVLQPSQYAPVPRFLHILRYELHRVRKPIQSTRLELRSIVVAER
jgi:hypothetical protein